MQDASKLPKIVRVVILLLLVASVILNFTDAVPGFFSGLLYGLLLGLLIWECFVYISGKRAD